MARPRNISDMKPPTEPSPLDQPEDEDDLVHLSELRSSAQEPIAPEVTDELAELQKWDEPVDERGHQVGAVADDESTLGEDLVQQGLDEADTEVRKIAAESPDGA